MAVTCLGLMWIRVDVAAWRHDTWQRGILLRGGVCRRVMAHWNFRQRVRVCLVSESTIFCAVESSVSRVFQRYQQCCDWSLGMASPRVAVGPFGDESAS